MALVWADGFDGYANSSTVGNRPKPDGVIADKYVGVGYESQMDMYNSDNRWGGSDWVLRFGGGPVYSIYMTTRDVVSGNTTIAGVAFRINDKNVWSSSQSWPVLIFRNDTGADNVRLVHTNGTFTVWGPTDNYLGGVTFNIERFVYHYIEMKVYHHNTEGTVEVRINGCPVLLLEDVDTLLTSGKPSTRVGIGDNTSIYCSQYSRVDDFYVCDGTGNTNNDFLGPVRIETLWPDGDDTANWSTTANSANHYENVNREVRDGSTDYVEESGSGVLDLFTMDDTSVSWDSIKGVVCWTGAGYSSSSAGLQQVVDSGGTTDNSSNITLTTGVLFQAPHVVETVPGTSNSWNSATINSIKTGFRTP